MKTTYQRKLTLSFLIIFVLFNAGIVAFEPTRARRYKTHALEEKLDAYADVIGAYMAGRGWQMRQPDSLGRLLPSNLRVTVIGLDGTVTFDNLVPDPAGLENHLGRPEVARALENGTGYDIRKSASNDLKYLYYAKYYGNAYVRVALPYDVATVSLLRPDNAFLYFVVTLFLVGLFFINYVGNYFGRYVRRMRDFSSAVSQGAADVAVPQFPDDELGEIGRRIADDYRKLKDSETQLSLEREKLLQHIHTSAEGVCFFDRDGSVAFYNGLFVQYLNVIGRDPDMDSGCGDNYYEYTLRDHGYEFLVRLNRFEDGSFELVLNDISVQEKTRRLKREMTGNIAHELRTPVTSIRGYLETILETPLGYDQQRDFTEKAYRQTLALSELIRDMGLLTKIEAMPAKSDLRPVDIGGVVDSVEAELRDEMSVNGIVFRNDIPAGTVVDGNEVLLHSVFRNLADNAIHHGGQNIAITVSSHRRGDGSVEISFADSGRGIVDESKLARIFERFYRIDEGRTREGGGSGLGLSIVRNAILVHGGNITARNRKGGGLEFIIHLPPGSLPPHGCLPAHGQGGL